VQSESTVSADSPEGVIQGKLRPPPLPEERVRRPRLEGRLREMVARCRVVVVGATAGAGKTTAVADAVAELDRPVAWLTLDRTDVAPGRLVIYLEAAIARQLPGASGVATGAVAAGIPHPEAAGLLAQAVGEEPLVLVLDDLERLGDSEPAWAVIEGLIRHAPSVMSCVLISRRELPADPLAPGLLEGSVGSLGEPDLAFTEAEAGDALAVLGEHELEPDEALEATGGWVTGVLFEAWRSDQHVAGIGGEADPLHGYLGSQIVDQLDEADREFLLATSLLDVVDASRAAALGLADPGERLASLRARHLPVAWSAAGREMQCHPRFREYLLTRLERWPAERLRELRVAHGRLLAGEGRAEDAVEELLRAGDLGEALAAAEDAILGVIERGDFELAGRWIGALAELPGRRSFTLATAELMLALATLDFRRGAEVAERLGERGELAELARSPGPAALLMCWCYIGLGWLDQVRRLLEVVAGGPQEKAIRYLSSGYISGPPPPSGPPRGSPLDAVVVDGFNFVHGNLGELTHEPISGWLDAVRGPWTISAYAMAGRTRRALELLDEAREHGMPMAVLDSYILPLLLCDSGHPDDALEAIERARARARETGAITDEVFADHAEARLRLRVDHDPAATLAVLERSENRHGRTFAFSAEQLDMWYGGALLFLGEDERALERLRASVASMVEADRALLLPTAAVYLAEAEWRAGNEDAADRAADLALEAARRQDSNHLLLLSLADFPAVLSRRLDAEPAVDSPWHELGRALILRGVAVEGPIRTSVELREFGRREIIVDGEERRPRIAKTYELLAFLLTRPGCEAERAELLDALFEGRADESARSYLRQAVRWLRHALPEESAPVVEEGRVRLGEDVRAISESTQFETMLAEGARLRGTDRLSAIREALEIADQGEYLPRIRSRWVEERRHRLAELATDARHEAAALAFEAGRFYDAERMNREVLASDPLRESAWRLTMRIANALGDEDGVIRAYQSCERALAEIGAEPGQTSRELLARLRR
jgi:DNA-binding SARP family transcriptional activator